VLRITINEEAKKITLKLEGRVVGPWAEELERTWHSLGRSLDDKKLSVDLCGVAYVDRQGRGILADIYRRTHARFEADTPLTQYFAEEARNSNFNNGDENVNGSGHRKSNHKGEPK
jgi:ABC-type transporter Mla MlaB component